MNRVLFSGALCALSLLCAAPLSAQSLSTHDDGSAQMNALGSGGGPSTQAPGALTTTFVSDNSFAGNMFDITPNVDLEFTGLDINCGLVGQATTIEVWYRVGTSIGFEADPLGDWLLLDPAASYGGASAGQDLATFIDVSGNGVIFSAGTTYGIYVNLTSYGPHNLHYTNGTVGGDTFANSDLTLLTNAGLTDTGFSGSIFQVRNWNGTVYYETSASGGPVLTVTGTCPGTVTFDLVGATPLAIVGLLYGPAGTFVLPPGTCGGTVVDIASPTLGVLLFPDLSGAASLSVPLPAAACGMTVQIVDTITCLTSNTAVL